MSAIKATAVAVGTELCSVLEVPDWRNVKRLEVVLDANADRQAIVLRVTRYGCPEHGPRPHMHPEDGTVPVMVEEADLTAGQLRDVAIVLGRAVE